MGQFELLFLFGERLSHNFDYSLSSTFLCCWSPILPIFGLPFGLLVASFAELFLEFFRLLFLLVIFLTLPYYFAISQFHPLFTGILLRDLLILLFLRFFLFPLVLFEVFLLSLVQQNGLTMVI